MYEAIIAAVSARKVSLPRLTMLNPLFLAKDSSLSVQPPSGPMKAVISTFKEASLRTSPDESNRKLLPTLETFATASSKDIGSKITGTIPLPDCSAASLAIFSKRSLLRFQLNCPLDNGDNCFNADLGGLSHNKSSFLL